MLRSARSLTGCCAVAAGLLLAAGCGGGHTPATTSTSSPPAQRPDGRSLFATSGCASCHTLAAAGAHGKVGPNLDDLRPDTQTVIRQVTNGGGGMPAFRDALTAADIRAVARYVARATREGR